MATGPAGYSRDEDIATTARAQLDEAAAMVQAWDSMQREVLATLVELWPTAAWLAAGCRSAKAWLLAYTNLSYHEAHRLEGVAELCAAHPELAEAVTSGAMPVKRAAVLARFATPERARHLGPVLASLLRLNESTSDDESFSSAVRYWAERVDEHTAPRRTHPHTLALTPSLFGGGDINGQLAPGAFANVAAAIAAWTQDPDPADAPYRRSFRERQADALDDMAAASLTGTDHPDDDDDPGWGDEDEEAEFEDLLAEDTFDGSCDTDELDEQLAAGEDLEDLDPLEAWRRHLQAAEKQRRRRRRRRVRPRSGATVNTIVDVRTLLGLRDETDLEDLVLRGDGWPLTRGLLERLACDSGMLVTLFDGKNKILDANTRSERFTKAQRRALAARDLCCVFPGCTRAPRHCDAHHLHHREHGGPTTTANGALGCRFHHRLIHEYGWKLEIHDGHWVAIDPHGQTWTGRPAPPELATAD